MNSRLSVVTSGLLLVFGIGVSACDSVGSSQSQGQSHSDSTSHNNDVALTCDNSGMMQAFNAQKSDVQVRGCGIIQTVLPDDTKGSQHQRLIVALSGVPAQHTVLIAHNIDLAPKAMTAKKGKTIHFYGEYEYNPKGGVVHWTHHDPAGRHQGGWIQVDGQRYE